MCIPIICTQIYIRMSRNNQILAVGITIIATMQQKIRLCKQNPTSGKPYYTHPTKYSKLRIKNSILHCPLFSSSSFLFSHFFQIYIKIINKINSFFQSYYRDVKLYIQAHEKLKKKGDTKMAAVPNEEPIKKEAHRETGSLAKKI